MQVMLMRLMSKGEYLIVPKGTKFTGSGKLGLMENLKGFRYPTAAKFEEITIFDQKQPFET